MMDNTAKFPTIAKIELLQAFADEARNVRMNLHNS